MIREVSSELKLQDYKQSDTIIEVLNKSQANGDFIIATEWQHEDFDELVKELNSLESEQ